MQLNELFDLKTNTKKINIKTMKFISEPWGQVDNNIKTMKFVSGSC